jgi:hypothetical protein
VSIDTATGNALNLVEVSSPTRILLAPGVFQRPTLLVTSPEFTEILNLINSAFVKDKTNPDIFQSDVGQARDQINHMQAHAIPHPQGDDSQAKGVQRNKK